MRSWFSSALALGLLACGGSGDVTIDGGADGSAALDGATDAAADGIAPGPDAADASTKPDAPSFGGRLFVSQETAGVAVWDGAESLAADVAPTFTMSDGSVSAGTRAALAVGERLVVAPAEGGLVAFDGARTLGGGAAPSAAVPASAFMLPTNSPKAVTLLAYDEKTDTLWAGGFWGTDRFDSGAALASSSTPAALFSHPWYQLPSFAYDSSGDRAFLGQISGAGLLAWNGAKSATGSPTPSFTLDQKVAAWSMTVAQDRLYAAGPDSSSTTAHEAIDVWKGISSVTGAKAPDFSLRSAFATTDFSPWVTVASDTLFACVQSGKVLVWKNASGLNGDVAPDFTLTTELNQPQKALLGPVTGRLYVLDSEGVAIYANGATSPTFVAKIKTGIDKPHDLVVLE